jgi:uncharacterized membrane protein
MTTHSYRRLNKIVFILVGVICLISFYLEMAFLSFLVIGLYMGLISLVRTRVKGVLADERQQSVAEKAAQVSFQVLMPILLLASVALITSGGKQEFYYVKALGVVLSYVTSLGLIIFLLTYWYFDQKSGGNLSDK